MSNINKLAKWKQSLIGISIVAISTAFCYSLSDLMGYKVVALILLLMVSVTAMFFDIIPVLIIAFLSALCWDFFFIPPTFTLLIDSAENALMLVMYFVIALINAVLTYKSRQWQKLENEKDEKINALKLYDSVLNSLSHELRTPISTIIGAADNLKSTNSKLSHQDKSDLISEISKASLTLNRHVENLLNMSRLESGAIKPIKDWCDVGELLFSIKNNVTEQSNNHTITITISNELPLCFLDSGLIYQAIYNLVFNAIIYTPTESLIIISATCSNNNLEIIIEDNGPGFPLSETKQVFSKFYKTNNSKTGGIGLGLSITKGFIEAHQGKIKLENKINSGAKFTLYLPVETTQLNNLKNE